MKKSGLLIIISGFSGVGKGTIVKYLLDKYPDKYMLSVSVTTRNPRIGEREGIDYFFVKKNEFKQKIKNNEFLEYANYIDNYYGTPREYVIYNLNRGFNVILEIEFQGALKVKKQFPQALMIFIIPPNVKGLIKRLYSRRTENDKAIRARIDKAKEEVLYIEKYDYIIINDNLYTSVNNISKLVESEKNRTMRNLDNIKILQKEFENL